jgi:eukaryotic-like serine/threonine-protein kinase
VLQGAHAESIIHRDLKPANLMIVDANTPYEILKVMDFGLAKLLGPETANPRLSVSNNDFAVGTPGYMCPEQARGDDMDNRGDLYSVGVILYELLTGQLPFAGKSTMDMLLAHAVEPPPAFSLLGAGQVAPPAVESVVQWCLAKDPADRPTSARDVSESFEAALASSEETAGGEYAPTRPNPRPEASHLGPARQPPHSATAPTAAPDEFPEDHDPLTTVHRLAAWMPESIAAYKLRGFINDVGGEVVESVPGRIRVRLGGKGSVYDAPQRGSLSWLGIGRKLNRIDMELRLQRCEEGRDGQLHITVLLRPPSASTCADPAWRQLCTQIFCDLRGYLMGQTGVAAGETTG